MISDQFSVISFNKGCNADGADDTDLRGFLWFEIISTKYSSLQLVILTKERSHHAIKKTIWKQLLKVIRFDKIAHVCHSAGIYYGQAFFKIKSTWKEIIRDSSEWQINTNWKATQLPKTCHHDEGRSQHAIKKTIWKQLLKVICFNKIAQVYQSAGIYNGRELFKIKSAWKEIIRDSSRVTNKHE